MEQESNQSAREFRDRIGTVDQEGKRIWLYPYQPKGKLYNRRTVVSILQIGVLVGLPFLHINGNPALLLNILERRLHFFGLVFHPQDAFLLALFLITSVVFIFLFTVIFGRVWCGWLCPQTVFMEMIFRKIEYWIEGDAREQKKLNAREMDPDKLAKKVSKHVIFYAISFVIGNVFLAYFIGVKKLFIIITDPPSQHVTGLLLMIIFSFIFYGVFSWFREQACLIVCPYGRFQSVLQDDNTMMISYDYARGEPRGKYKMENDSLGVGDCVNCKMCVRVCPTGIDIRNGLQMECVNCTACIDSCDAIMDKLKKPRGLIRYASNNMIKDKTSFKVTPKIIGYSCVFLLLASINIVLHFNRKEVEVVISRVPGMLYQKIDEEHISNFYEVRVLNNSFEKKRMLLKILQPPNAEARGEIDLLVEPDDNKMSRMFVVLKNNDIKSRKTKVVIGVVIEGKVIKELETVFVSN